MTPGSRVLSDRRGKRYGEVVLVFLDGTPRIDVYNSFPLNDSPEDLWLGLDATLVADECGASAAVLNGPRYWMMDGIGKIDSVEPVMRDFGGIAMRRVATIDAEGPVHQEFYVERHVNRGAIWYFDAGKSIHELVAPNGTTFVLQAYCVGVDESLTRANLSELGQRLSPPDGWSFRTRVLDEELVVDTTEHVASVLQDEFHKTYTLAR